MFVVVARFFKEEEGRMKEDGLMFSLVELFFVFYLFFLG
jgi:hypothetical protein